VPFSHCEGISAMTADAGRNDSVDEPPYRIAFFAPDRPVEGCTIYVQAPKTEDDQSPAT
jgi:hypothetical protein